MGLLDGTTQKAYYQNNDYGNYQFVSLQDIISQFMVVYVGEDKLIRNASRTDVAFHAQRGLAELSFDTLKSFKSQEIILPASLQMILPQDYVQLTQLV
jgi:tRNA U38,U39,U40 pseudouridine synthase TruA